VNLLAGFSKNYNGKLPKKFYMAHRISNRAEVKRLCFKLQKIGIETHNPFYNPDGSYIKGRPEIKRIDEGKQDLYSIRTKPKAETIVRNDLRTIDVCDGTIAFIKGASIGTSMEIFYTSWNLRKVVYVITEKYYKHAWILTFADEIFRTPDEFIKWYSKEKRKEDRKKKHG